MRNVFIKMYRRFTHPNVAMLEMAQSLWFASALQVAVGLDLAGRLEKGSKSISELALESGVLEEPLYRVMRVLASNDIFKELKNRHFCQTALSATLMENQLGHFISIHLKPLQFRMFGEIMYSLKTGKPSLELFMDSPLFEELGNSAVQNEDFNKAMTSSSAMQAAALLPVFPFKKFEKIIDIGGGHGFFLASVLSRNKQISGLVFDLPHVVGSSADLFEKYGIADRAESIGGSFFEFVPGGGSLYILKNILHDWNDDDCLKILSCVNKAMPEDSSLLVIETVIEENNLPSFGKMTDLLMMLGAGGKERSKKEFIELMSDAGFSLKKIYETISPLKIMEWKKVKIA